MINLKILFKNKTKYTKTVYDKFLIFHNKKYQLTYMAYTTVIVIFILSSLILQVKYHNFTIAIVLCCGLTVFVFWRFFRPITEVSNEYKSEKIQKEKEFTFAFYPKYFIVEDDKQYSKIKYYQLYRVFETVDFFYLYLDKKHAFLLDKTKFKKDNPSEFSSFIKKNCWWCFKKVN